MFNVVLIEPEIPTNTGNIGRTCVATGSHLHLVGKLGFEINDKQLRRAGLDYWQFLQWSQHDDWNSWWSTVDDPSRVFFFSTKAQKVYSEQVFLAGDSLVFGRETGGLGENILKQFAQQSLTIPIELQARSLNLSNAVAIALFEARRQCLK